MNKEQIINEAYENYTQTKIIKTYGGETHISPTGHYNGMAKEQFINKCKTDPEFSEKWGLKIEERELSLEERNEIRDMQYFKNNLHQALKGSDTKIDWENIPTKLITITYNNETIESYE
jgi:hypothetical protein